MNKLRVAVIGAGPSGLYAAAELLKRDRTAQVDLFDRLPTPGGLVRSGVSPDHAARRAVIETYERIVLGSGRYRYHGNVEIGQHLSADELLQHCHAVIHASGAAADRRLGIPGEDLPGSHAATEFVAWYNGHPDYADRHFDFSGERAVVIGNGNVALDVARILLLGVDHLRHTDIADHALAALADSRIREVMIVGRRGPAQASFTAPELLELQSLSGIETTIEPADTLAGADAGRDFGRGLRLQLLRECAARAAGGNRRLRLRFLAAPLEVLGKERVAGLRFARTELQADTGGNVRAALTADVEDVSASLVLRAVGYRGRALPGLPFDEARGVLPSERGRVSGVRGHYVSGWLKRGPRGVIGTNKACSQETVCSLLDDYAAGRLPSPVAGADALERLIILRQPQRIDIEQWKTIDRAERSRGRVQQRPRVKLPSIGEMLAVAGTQPVSGQRLP